LKVSALKEEILGKLAGRLMNGCIDEVFLLNSTLGIDRNRMNGENIGLRLSGTHLALGRIS
jgi:hypothetical protein